LINSQKILNNLTGANSPWYFYCVIVVVHINVVLVVAIDNGTTNSNDIKVGKKLKIK